MWSPGLLYQKNFCTIVIFFLPPHVIYLPDVQEILFVAYALHTPMVTHCTLTISQTDLKCNNF